DFAPVGYFTLTREALIKEANLTCATLLGVARQKLMNTGFRRFVAPSDLDQWNHHFLSVLQQGEKRSCDLTLKRQDGSIFSANLESIRSEVSGGKFEAHSILTDITKRKRLEREEVKWQSEERYRTVIEEIDEGYYEVDLAGNFTFVNDSMIRQLQQSWEELIGTNYRRCILPEEVDEVYKIFNRVYRTGEVIKWFPITNIRKDGTPIFTEDSISCRRDSEGRVIGFRGIFRDVSSRKQAEDQLLVSLRDKDVLLREIHHRVKNNLQVIQSLLNLQARKIKDPLALEAFKESRDRIRSMSLVHEKLYQSPDLDRINMDDYLRNLSINLFHSYKVKEDRVNLKVEVEDVQVSIDKAIPLGLIVNELISNGLKHAFPGERAGEIRVGLVLVNEGMIRLTVEDNGIGFPREVDFRKTESMGFQVVTTLVRQLKGTMGFHQEVGTGFQITLPRK
ncbi:MAG: histidine kinase dimerization/phosphoacceptor domain -containing protein, partial [Pseudomonadota bacterium]